MADIKDSKNWGFETKQVHIGQEQADPVTEELFQFMRPHHTYSITHSMQLIVLAFAMPAIFTAD